MRYHGITAVGQDSIYISILYIDKGIIAGVDLSGLDTVARIRAMEPITMNFGNRLYRPVSVSGQFVQVAFDKIADIP